MILLPYHDGTISSDWILGGVPGAESYYWASLDDDNGDTSFVSCDDNNETMIIDFANPSVAEADIDFNETVSVRFLSSGRSTDRRNASEVAIAYHVPSGFPETCSYDAHASSYESIQGTAQSSKPGGGGWEYSDLEDLEMICTKIGTKNVQLSYLALRVDYTEAATTNATFFGANF